MRGALGGLGLLALGTAVVAVPDRGDRLVSLSEEHGPGVLDALGTVVLLAGYLLLARAVWQRRGVLPCPLLAYAGAVVAAGLALLVPAIALDLGPLWVLAAAVMAVPQAYLLVRALRAAP